MRFSLASLIRLIAFAALGSSALAIGISRALPRPTGAWVPAQPRYMGVNGVSFLPPGKHDYLIDTETGKIRKADFGSGVSVDFASSSPWRQAGGRIEVVGRLINCSGSAKDRLYEGSGLGVMDLESGELLEELKHENEPVISGRPCWFPGNRNRLIYPAGDGQLYVHNLNRQEGPEGLQPRSSYSSTRSRSGRPLTWKCEPPSEEPFILSDPIFPPDPAFHGQLFVSLMRIRKSGQKHLYQSTELWALQIDEESSTIIAANRLTESAASHSLIDERLPNLIVSPEGQPLVAYLSRARGEQAWRLTLGLVRFDPNSRLASTERSSECEVAFDHAVTVPCFSADGRSIFAVARCKAPADSVTRIDLKAAIATLTTPPDHILSAQSDRGRQTD